MFKSQQKHKAMHNGYKQKPSQSIINATLMMYMDCHEAISNIVKPSVPNGTQLKLEL